MSDEPLTRDGVRVLRGELARDENTGTLLQVLSIHRCTCSHTQRFLAMKRGTALTHQRTRLCWLADLVDPALAQLLRDAGHDRSLERDVFDVVVSDGAHKIKCLLAPALNHVIWRGQVAPLDILWVRPMLDPLMALLSIKHAALYRYCIKPRSLTLSDHTKVTEFVLLTVPADTRDTPARTVCLILDFEPIAQENNAFLVASSLLATPTRGRECAFVEQTTGDALTFSPNATSARDTALLPLAGERLYYMLLDSDSSALQLLQDAHVVATTAKTAPSVCTSVFAPGTDVLYSIDDVTTLLAAAPSHARGKAKDAASPAHLPPITGVVRATSSVVHVGEPAIANPLPFVFHIVLGTSPLECLTDKKVVVAHRRLSVCDKRELRRGPHWVCRSRVLRFCVCCVRSSDPRRRRDSAPRVRSEA